MKKILFKNRHLLIGLIIFAGIGALGYWAFRTYSLFASNSYLRAELDKTKQELASTSQSFNSVSIELASTTAERNKLKQDFLDENARVNSLVQQVQGISGAVSTLEKINRTDPELLEKYSRVYFLNEHYIPSSLVKITPEYVYDKQKEVYFHAGVWPFLKNLLDDASASKIGISIVSGYRSFGTQAGLKSYYNFTYGAGTSNQFVADQGYSEHQLGTTADFTDPKLGPAFTDFQKTAASKWLLANAYKYGFILSYPEDNSYFYYEPWHWRFVGIDLALRLHNEAKNFYDLDQREINKYLVSFFD